jgi:hypothetical protein
MFLFATLSQALTREAMRRYFVRRATKMGVVCGTGAVAKLERVAVRGVRRARSNLIDSQNPEVAHLSVE